MKAAFSAWNANSAATSNGTKSGALKVMAVLDGTFGLFKHSRTFAGLRTKIPSRSCPCDGDPGIAVAPPVDLRKRSGPGDLHIRALLEDCDRPVTGPTAFNCGRKRAFSQFFAVRRVAEDEIERLERAQRAELGCIAPPDLGDAGQAQRLHIAADGCARLGALLDEDTEAGAARQRLEAERAGAGEEIEHAGAFELEMGGAVLQHIE